MNTKIPISEILLVGSDNFCSRLKEALKQKYSHFSVFTSPVSGAWGTALSEHPSVVICEIDVSHNSDHQSILRSFLEKSRDRFGEKVFQVLALTAPEKLYFAGDLLFQEGESLDPSLLIDSFLAQPPGSLPTLMTLEDQTQKLIEIILREFERREAGRSALPSLGHNDWVQSLADPVSLDLWMRWLPRYASYTNESPLIIGETGTGKTKLARALHVLSGRSGKFISITPRDFSSSELVQAELFGAVAGAYTGAVDKWGLVKSAEKGTLFIDELQSIDKDLQGKLITFIENKAYRRVGSAETITADVRFVFASNRTLSEMMQKNILRDDFAYRLERVQLELPALHNRSLDLSAALAHALARVYRLRPQGSIVEGFSQRAYHLLFGHRWPGNLRQLENITAKLTELADMENRNLINETDVTHALSGGLAGVPNDGSQVISRAARLLTNQSLTENIKTIHEGLEYFEELIRVVALEASGGDVQQAAKLIQDSPEMLQLLFSKKTEEQLSDE